MYKGRTKNENEINNILQYPKTKDINIVSKDARYRLKKKSEHFRCIENTLYLIGNEKFLRVISDESMETMKFKLIKLHGYSSHPSVNKLEYLTNQKGSNKNFVEECFTCQRALPVKAKDKPKHAKSKKPFEKIQIDLIDLRKYSDNEEEYKWILTIIDICIKFAFVIH
ncbi:hypothetical protein SLOPH_2484 [Spraguea lophii 42_110]|uniref:Integrase zinc-binding domain-containing protein n=1 Tax=Spraguea lophii (strain 42_110) TaxID=1358809 RepID=S7W695_SPRLO|nr:hypothetical protein SLOPH_2484 [Spraguea lophii 42_110]